MKLCEEFLRTSLNVFRKRRPRVEICALAKPRKILLLSFFCTLGGFTFAKIIIKCLRKKFASPSDVFDLLHIVMDGAQHGSGQVKVQKKFKVIKTFPRNFTRELVAILKILFDLYTKHSFQIFSPESSPVIYIF
jgi:hypothetical protein